MLRLSRTSSSICECSQLLIGTPPGFSGVTENDSSNQSNAINCSNHCNDCNNSNTSSSSLGFVFGELLGSTMGWRAAPSMSCCGLPALPGAAFSDVRTTMTTTTTTTATATTLVTSAHKSYSP